MATYQAIAEALVYGWSIDYVVKIEGVTVLLHEQDFGAADPTGYTSDAALVVDDSATIGAVVDRRKGIGRGFDLSIRLLDTAAVRGLFTRPSNRTSLTADIAYDDANPDTIAVGDTTGFPSSGVLYVGTEAIAYSSTTATTFTISATTTRGTYGKAYDHPFESMTGTVVSDGPLWWRGRGVKLYAVPVDPMGNVPGADLLAEAALIWRGFIETNPLRVDGLWALDARSIDRKLDRDLTAPVSGTGVWTFDDDPEVTADPFFGIQVRVGISEWDDAITAFTSSQTDYTIFPNDGFSIGAKRRMSEIRESFRSAWATATSGAVTDWIWEPHLALDAAGAAVQWRASVRVDASAASLVPIVWAQSWHVGGTFPGGGYSTGEGGPALPPKDDADDDFIAFTGFSLWRLIQTATLSVRVDEGDPADIPATGFVVLETDGARDWFEYTSAAADPGNPGHVLVEFDGTKFDLTSMVVDAIQGQETEVSVTFAFRDSGPAVDTMRRMLLSSGRGDNDGTYDTLPLQQGYDIESVDVASFAEVMDGAWEQLDLNLLLDSGASFTRIYGGLLSLSQRAVVPVSDGSDVDLRAVHVGLADTGPYSVTVTDSDLVTTGGGSPVRPKAALNNPNKITAKLRAVADEPGGQVVANDLAAMRAHGTTAWGVDVYGLRRSVARDPIIVWSRSIFATSQLAQIVEMDTRPSLAIDVGDKIRVDSNHWTLWQYSTGTPGYTGMARVLGRQIDLSTGVQTLTLLIDGVVRGMALSPSAPVQAIGGSPSAATRIDLPVAYEPVMSQYLASSDPFRVIAYDPGAEDASDDGYSIDGVTINGSVVELSVSAQHGTFSVAPGWYISVPTAANSNAAQNEYAHTVSDAIWI